MTIAAGFKHKTGILLCADTELNEGDFKIHGQKIFQADGPLGRCGIVCSGNYALGCSIIEKIQEDLAARKNGQIHRVIERILREEYKEAILPYPADERPQQEVWFVVAIQPVGKPVNLYVSQGMTLRAGNPRECVGFGGTFGKQIVEKALTSGSRSDSLLLATKMLGQVKKNIGFCGGMSLYVDFDNDGTVTPFYGDMYLEELEKFFGVFEMYTWNVVSAMANSGISDKDFHLTLDQFGKDVWRRRRTLAVLRERHVQTSEAYRFMHQVNRQAPKQSKHGQ